jgi:hypothetical protein
MNIIMSIILVDRKREHIVLRVFKKLPCYNRLSLLCTSSSKASKLNLQIEFRNSFQYFLFIYTLSGFMLNLTISCQTLIACSICPFFLQALTNALNTPLSGLFTFTRVSYTINDACIAILILYCKILLMGPLTPCYLKKSLMSCSDVYWDKAITLFR